MKLEDLNQKIESLAVGESLRLESVPEDVYHASEGWGSSRVKSFVNPDITPEEIKYSIENPPEKEKPHFRIGRAVHCAILEPERFTDEYVLQPKKYTYNDQKKGDVIGVINVRSGKAWTAFESDCIAKGLKILNEKEMKSVAGAAHSVRKRWGDLIDSGKPEVSFWRRWSETLVLKARLDCEIADYRIAIDIKSCANPHKFRYDAPKLFYDIQQIHYCWVAESVIDDFKFIPVGSGAPNILAPVFQLDPEDTGESMNQWEVALGRLEAAIQTGLWEGLKNTEETFRIPNWRRCYE